jgi:replicative DNA helicase
MFNEDQRAQLDEVAKVWRGPLPFNLLREQPSRLVTWALELVPDCGLLVVDSTKDLAVGLAKDEVGALLNLAFQEVVARGVELVLLHHERKAEQGGKRHHKLDDVYGSTWLTSGLGSVLALDGDPGDPTVELTHLKQPAAPVGPLRVRHDHQTGTSTVVSSVELLDLLVGAGEAGVTAEQAALAVLGRAAGADQQKIRYQLRKLVGDALAHKIKGHLTSSGAEKDRWAATAQARFARGETEHD